MWNPFIVGQWVRGDQFFGREQLLQDILSEKRMYTWLLGTRRMGKTSFLKQLEFLVLEEDASSPQGAVYWDLEGSRDIPGLKESLIEALQLAEDRLLERGICVDDIAEQDVFGILHSLRLQARRTGTRLFLLMDECEELLQINKSAPEALPRLRRVLQGGDNVSVVLVSTSQLSQLQGSKTSTSPFLHGFLPPAYLTPLSDGEASALIARGGFDERASHEIRRKTNNHPYLVQLVCKKLLLGNDLNKAVEDVCNDSMVSHFFSSDFQSLTHAQQATLHQIAEARRPFRAASRDEPGLRESLYLLEQLGFIRADGDSYNLANYFFERWMSRNDGAALQNADSAARKAGLSATSVRPPFEAHSLEPRKSVGTSTYPGRSIDRYKIMERIGAGGMGVVFRARDERLGREVAIKLLPYQAKNDPSSLRRFEREAKAAGSLNHPNLLTVFDVGTHEGSPYIVSELLVGQTLRERLNAGAFEPQAMLALGEEILQGLAIAHEGGVIHRDLKPENLIVTSEGRLKIVDFGLAKLIRHDVDGESTASMSAQTTPGAVMGTPAYMAPEQVRGEDSDARADIFSFGCVLYEMHIGKAAFLRRTRAETLNAVLNDSPEPISENPRGAALELQRLLNRCLDKHRSRRFQSARDLRGALARIRWS